MQISSFKNHIQQNLQSKKNEKCRRVNDEINILLAKTTRNISEILSIDPANNHSNNNVENSS